MIGAMPPVAVPGISTPIGTITTAKAVVPSGRSRTSSEEEAAAMPQQRADRELTEQFVKHARKKIRRLRLLPLVVEVVVVVETPCRRTLPAHLPIERRPTPSRRR
jgi:hypothetical protein